MLTIIIMACLVSCKENTDTRLEDYITENKETGERYLSNTLIVYVNDKMDNDIYNISSNVQYTIDDSLKSAGIYRVVYDEALTYQYLQDNIEYLNSLEWVNNAELDIVYTLDELGGIAEYK